MKQIFILTFLLIVNSAISQNLPNLTPGRIIELDFGPEIQKEWQIRDQTLKAISDGELKWEDMTEEQEKYVMKYGEVFRDIWDIIGDGCSWYCGGTVKNVFASSSLNQSDDITYNAQNAHDLNYKTAWVEGVKGYGIGEYLIYTFSAAAPRVTEIIIINGYVKNNSVWTANSRVKKLKLYYNNEPFALLNLEDKVAEQHFKFEQPFGNGNRSDLIALEQQNDWTLKFEILEVYNGAKYEDTVITEIYFNGIDVH